MAEEKNKPEPTRPAPRDIPLEKLKEIVEQAKVAPVTAEDGALLHGALDTLGIVTQELEAKGATIKKLRQLLFGAATETTAKVAQRISAASACAAGAAAENGGGKNGEKKPGHGRNGAAAYTGAEKVPVPHAALAAGCGCPDCRNGKVYPLEPAPLVRVTGMAPLLAKVYELGRFRCSLCGRVFTAQPPAGVGGEKYDETAAAMAALLKYGAGVPFYRLERLLASMGIPFPAAVQWEVAERAEQTIRPAAEELVRQAAQGQVLHNDDTPAKILEAGSWEDGDLDGRKKTQTTGIVSVRDGRRIALFFTGARHAGENLDQVLKRRAAELGPPVQMSDALAANTAGEFETIVSHCLARARREFADIAASFPAECLHVLEELREVYRRDGESRAAGMSPAERLSYHQEHSKPVMERLEKWMRAQSDERRVEPNSEFGKAMRYMLKRWDTFTLFLRVEGAPLDNNVCERALKKAVLHRKNALFYKTQNGARVGDAFMSLIHTAELCGANTFEYLVALLRHPREVKEKPGGWMPWNYEETLNRLPAGDVK